MKSQSISTILRAGALAALFVVGTSVSAFALPIVNFQTSGSFNGGAATILFTDGDGSQVRLTFFDGGPQSLDAPSNVQYGTVVMTLPAAGANGQFDGPIAPTTFDLTITQTAPSGGASTLSSTITGTLAKANSTDFFLSFGPGPFNNTNIGLVQYLIQSQYFLVPPAEGQIAGTTTLQGQLKAVPEPTTMMLLGTGLLAAFRARRKAA